MKLKKPCAGVIAVLALALSLMLVPQVGSAAGNDDLEFLQPPVVFAGDPDTGGQGRCDTYSLTQMWTLRVQTCLAIRFTSSGPSRPHSTILSRRPSSQRPRR